MTEIRIYPIDDSSWECPAKGHKDWGEEWCEDIKAQDDADHKHPMPA